MRTEDQIVTMSPVKVIFGIKEYEIKPLTVTAQGKWRDKLDQVMTPILAAFTGETTPTSFANAYGTALREAPNVFVSLVAEYGALKSEELADEATPEQVVVAFTAIMEMAFPFAKPLEMVTRLTATRSR